MNRVDLQLRIQPVVAEANVPTLPLVLAHRAICTGFPPSHALGDFGQHGLG
jgi:hypothetical protein